ncbi:MAG: hypothetical protein HZB44_07790 [Actinobacteria bacterium]|nr:hypothetical protein [Actinomycetota bacterium]
MTTGKGSNATEERSAVNRLRVCFAIAILVCALLMASSCDQADTNKAGNVDSFQTALTDGGFSLQTGKLQTVDVFAMAQAGLFTNANYQNAGAPYLSPRLPMAPGETAPPVFTDAALNPANSGLYIDYRLRPDEAIVLVGKTPPKCTYFGYDAEIVSRWSDQTGKPVIIFGNYGDPLNPMVIKTDGPQDDPYQRNTMIIMAADEGVADRITAAAQTAGYSPDIINVYVVPSQLLKLGLDGKSDTMTLLHRFAYPDDQQAGQDYMNNPTMQVFRVTPNETVQASPYDMPASRVRGTGDFRELELSATAEQLRQAILAKYSNLAAVEPVTSPWGGGADGVDGLDAVQQMQSNAGPGRDALYLRTTEFTLADDPNQFVVIYGINHAAIGRATYTSFSVYGTVQANGVASAWNRMYAGTAEEFLPGDPNAKYFYVWKIARHANGDPHTTEVPFDQGINGIDLDQSMFLGFRLYMEPSTMTGPIAMETYFDRAIEFSEKT